MNQKKFLSLLLDLDKHHLSPEASMSAQVVLLVHRFIEDILEEYKKLNQDSSTQKMANYLDEKINDAIRAAIKSTIAYPYETNRTRPKTTPHSCAFAEKVEEALSMQEDEGTS